MSKKTVLRLDLPCEKCKRRALKTVAGVQGVDSVAVDMKEKKVTVIGDADPVYLTTKLRKFGYTELVTVGPAKEEKKEDKKDDKQNVPTVVYLPTGGTPPYQGSYVLYDDNPNACCIS